MAGSKIINVFTNKILRTKSISAEALLSVNGEKITFRYAHYAIFTDFSRQPSIQSYEGKYQLLEDLNKFLHDVITEVGNSISIEISFVNVVDPGDVD